MLERFQKAQQARGPLAREPVERPDHDHADLPALRHLEHATQAGPVLARARLGFFHDGHHLEPAAPRQLLERHTLVLGGLLRVDTRT